MSDPIRVSDSRPVMSEILPAVLEPELSDIAWQPAHEITFDEWRMRGEFLQRVGRAMSWWIGDHVLYGRRHFKDRVPEAMDFSGYRKETVDNLAWVAESIPPDQRREGLSWSHHHLTVAMSRAERTVWLDLAATESLTVNRLRARINDAKRRADSAHKIAVWSGRGHSVEEIARGVRLSPRAVREEIEALPDLPAPDVADVPAPRVLPRPPLLPQADDRAWRTTYEITFTAPNGKSAARWLHDLKQQLATDGYEMVAHERPVPA